MSKDLEALRDVLQETLQRRGVLNEVRSRLWAEIFAALDEGEDLAGKGKAPYEVGQENLLINELIREYLTYNGYKHTLSVFMPESGQPTDAGEKITLSYLQTWLHRRRGCYEKREKRKERKKEDEQEDRPSTNVSDF